MLANKNITSYERSEDMFRVLSPILSKLSLLIQEVSPEIIGLEVNSYHTSFFR